jgi:hypothetical protein
MNVVGMFYLFFLLFVSFNVQAVLEKVRVLSDGSHTISIFSDVHIDFDNEDKQQLETFTRSLVERNKRRDLRPLEVLIEVPNAIKRYFSEPNVLTCLDQEIRHLKLDSVSAKDIEIRHTAILAIALLDSCENPAWLDPEIGWMDHLSYGNVTCVDILNECMHYFNVMQSKRPIFEKFLGKYSVWYLFSHFMVYHDSFLNTLHLLNIRPEKPIFAQLQEIYEQHEVLCTDGVTRSYNEVRKLLMDSLNFASSLFDIHMVYNVLMVPKIHDVAVVVGGHHASMLSSVLTGRFDSGYERISYHEGYVPRISEAEQNSTTKKRKIGVPVCYIAQAVLNKRDSCVYRSTKFMECLFTNIARIFFRIVLGK